MTDRTFFTPTLADAFNQAGMPYPDNVGTGNFERFCTSTDKQDKAGWLQIFPDSNSAAFGCWREGTSYIWQQRIDGEPMPTSRALHRAKTQAAKARKQAETERDKLHSKTAKRLEAEYARLPLATADKAYCKSKGIAPPRSLKQRRLGQLVVPVYDGDGRLQSLQDIHPSSRKQFAKDAKMQGGRFVFGELVDGESMTLCEGLATSASVFESGIGAVVNCFSGSNLAVVAADLRNRYPNSYISIASDLDAHGKGAEYARAAVAEAMPNSGMVLPEFSDMRDKGDFNDLHLFADLEEVRSQLEKCDHAGSATGDLDGECEANPLPSTQPFEVPALPVADSRDGTATTRPLTEHGNALRLLDLFGGRLSYVIEVKDWMVWRDDAWTWDTAGAFVRELAGSLATSIYKEGETVDMVQAQLFAKHARSSQNVRTIDAAVSLLSVQTRIRVALAMIDADPMLIGFDHSRQAIDLRTGQARPATPADYITKSLTPCTIGDSAMAVRWLLFLEQIFDGDAELIDWLHRWCGYLLTGNTSEQILLFFFGLGANGKSVFGELLKFVMGEYARTIPPETFTEGKRQAGGASPDLAGLVGCRLAMSSETEDGSALNEPLIKSLTGGDTITARQLYKGYFEFVPAFKPLMLGNHKPIIRGTDYGIWRRVRLVPFMRTFSEVERDPHLLDTLKAEAQHILAWMVLGCMEWQRRGLDDVPAAIENQTAEYREEQDIIGRWLSECTNLDCTAETNGSEIYANYQSWAIESGLRPMSTISLGRRLKERGLESRRSNGMTLWVGIRLIANNGDCGW